ncbi:MULTISPECIES: alanyl-tRNA editing protein [Priestia]|jgi:Ser-tRNA(Ala) deacylase AlaX|uniref:alanyl-tRNA editing protein n=1 Tax=Priestia TaxID=2800373 RepID=UPI000BECF5D5|nr:alanyl-tRNA editing protein [Priestia megaterium]MDH2363193.1 alanyl-tRNA editing protein [Priestia megaterium]PEE77763.1 alanyl-tRNA editing protein [Priestia megaterium]PFI95605.1 alanyl-tRNA editing protein [Priestia megaterium]PGR05866.1 alanyl-tRNA editing protein [Priestia megaterium]
MEEPKMEKEIFLENSYQTSCKTFIKEINENKVILSQTVFYPTGGGQPFDTGAIKQGNHEVEVVKVRREQGEIVHYVQNAENLTLGEATVHIDWDRRYRFMRYHTLLHVIAGHLYNKFGALATSNEIYEDNRARIDIKFEKEISEDYFTVMEKEIQDIIEENHLISTRSLPREEVEKIPGSIKTVINLLPKSIQTIRLVEISELDEQACGGTHVKSTNEIGSFSFTKVKNKSRNGKRIEVILKD